MMGKSEERRQNKSFSEASKMLEAALLQMDDIISGACAESGDSEWKDAIKEATRNLLSAIKTAPTPPPPPDCATIEILLQWLQPVRANHRV